MGPRGNDDVGRLIDRIVAAATKGEKGAAAQRLERFVRHYFEHVPPQDIEAETAANLAGLVRAHHALGKQRRPGKAHVRVYNPDAKKDGWSAGHSIVEIVNDDMPFLVDSVTAELNRQDLDVYLAIHPIYKLRRDAKGTLSAVLALGEPDVDTLTESWMHLQITEQSGKRLDEVKKGVEGVLADVRAGVDDWRPMRERMAHLIEQLDVDPKGITHDEARETREFLRWIHDNHFTFLGFREYRVSGSKQTLKITKNPSTGLGLMRDPKRSVFEELDDPRRLTPEIRAAVAKPNLLVICKANQRSTVHRPVHLDTIAVKLLDGQGRVAGLCVFFGLFTSVAYNRSPRDIPLLRMKLQQVIERAGFPPASHDGKALLNILESFPRDELLQVSEQHLFSTALGILHLQERQRVALFVRRDAFQRFISCLVYVPRERYTTDLRRRLQDILAERFGGHVAAYFTTLGDSPLARLHVIIAVQGNKIPAYDAAQIELELAEASRSWADHLQSALTGAHGEEHGLELLARYGDAFGAGYRDRTPAEAAVADIGILEDSLTHGRIGLHLHCPPDCEAHQARFKIYKPDQSIPLSEVLPIFEHMGFRVLDEGGPHLVNVVGHGGTADGDVEQRYVIHDFGLEARSGEPIDTAAIKDNFEEAFRRVWDGEIESDGFNALVPAGGLTWREAVVLRAYCKYLRQTGITFSQVYMEQTLARNAKIARQIVDLFMAMFDPARPEKKRGHAVQGIRGNILQALDAVESADEDRIIRRFLNAVSSTLRTNYFQPDVDGGHKPYVSFKLDSRALEELPLPRPFREIWVYSPRVEGVHLRFGYVARGGLRWSDRPEDFRTEILGLVKAQQVKNAVIVPVGSKGGFVLKRPPQAGGREAMQEEGIACYKLFLSGLLDITDNIKGNRVVPPKRVVRRDDDDPYLVVAADKGTATFSDIANGVSEAYGHWLGDAFASGGSQGYDHKKMGITARGGWESVKRHFREIGHDTQRQDFTCVGVGDMSGDVFGNGMLLSKHIKLLAAFNHLHIFVDPDPDPASSFEERKRLFKLQRSSWDDYDKRKLSKGGAVFERRAKTLKVSPEIKALFELEKDTVTPNELMQAILRAEADLMWFGGIGTYVKAEEESNSEVGDRANDAIRINGRELRCKVIGEGANLGVTQLGRIEYAEHGGRLNTDSIDNSAGVDSSDHEVNIKILLNGVVASDKLTMPSRNKLLAKMTEEVGQLVLTHNYAQTQAITLINARGVHVLENQERLMRTLERLGRLDRNVEYLPDDEQLGERLMKKKGLYRPEIAVLMSYAKIWIYDELLASDFPDDAYLFDDLVKYFPTPLQKTYRADIGKHRLKREIVVTRATNSMVNRVGGTFVTEFMEKTGRAVPDIARAYIIARESFDMREIWGAIEALDNKVPTACQTSMLLDANQLIEWVTLWFLRNGEEGLDIGRHVQAYRDGLRELAKGLNGALPKHYLTDLKGRAEPYLADGAPEGLAMRVANLVNLYSGCDIVRLASRRKLGVLDVARIYFAVGTRFRLGRLRAAASQLDGESHWQQLAVAALIEEIYNHQLHLAEKVLDHAGAKTATQKAVEGWVEANRKTVAPTEQLLAELWNTEVDDLSMIAVASRQLRTMAEGKTE